MTQKPTTEEKLRNYFLMKVISFCEFVHRHIDGPVPGIFIIVVCVLGFLAAPFTLNFTLAIFVTLGTTLFAAFVFSGLPSPVEHALTSVRAWAVLRVRTDKKNPKSL